MGSTGWVVAGFVLVVWPGPVIFWTAVSHYRHSAFLRRRGRTMPPLGFAGWVRYYLHTLGSSALLVAWALRATFADGLRLPAEVRGAPVLCVHGFHLAGYAMWGIRRTLERRGRPTRAVFLGLPYRSPQVYARSLTRALAALEAARPGEPVDVVAHSMGGLVLRLALAGEPELAARVRRIVTLGTPHHGTALLRWIRSGPVYRMMGFGVPFLESLPPFSDSVPWAEVTTIATAHDLVVFPVETAHLAGARQITLERVGHLGLVTARRVRRLVADRLDG